MRAPDPAPSGPTVSPRPLPLRVALFVVEELLMGLGVVARLFADGGYGAADRCYGAAARLRALRLT